MKVKAVYTNKAPGGVAYRCSFRITEAVYLVERMVDALALEMKVDPIDLRMQQLHRHRPVPVRDDHRLDVRLRRLPQDDAVAMDIAGYEDLRQEQEEKRARGELMGIGISFFTEGVGAGPRKHMDILGLSMNDGADLRVHPSGKAVVSSVRPDPGPGPRDDVRADRRRGAGHPARGRRGPPRRHRQVAVRARHLRLAVHAGIRRRRRGRLAQGARQGARDRGARCSRRAPRTSRGRRAAGTSRATRARARRSSTSPSARTPASRCPRAWRAAWTRRSSTTRRTSPTPTARTSRSSTSTPRPRT